MTDLDRKAVITDGSADVAVGRQRRVENHMALNAEISLFSRILRQGFAPEATTTGLETSIAPSQVRALSASRIGTLA